VLSGVASTLISVSSLCYYSTTSTATVMLSVVSSHMSSSAVPVSLSPVIEHTPTTTFVCQSTLRPIQPRSPCVEQVNMPFSSTKSSTS